MAKFRSLVLGSEAKRSDDRIRRYRNQISQPIFVRIIEELETTGTFKLKKNDLREEAYHLDKVKGNQVFIKKPGQSTYVPLDSDYYEVIESGEAGF